MNVGERVVTGEVIREDAEGRAQLRFGDPFLVRSLHASLWSAGGEIIDVL